MRPKTLASLLILIATGGAVGWLVMLPPRAEITGVAEAIDGDSLRLSGQEIRLRGIDAPELDQTCRVAGRSEACGRAARQALRRILALGLVTCLDEGRDRYGRMLGRCLARGQDIAAAMVRDGQAVGYGGYAAEEAEARAAYRGLWAGEFQRPEDWRRANPRSPVR
jgi:endonuclease YncB( thermonuclease family)